MNTTSPLLALLDHRDDPLIDRALAAALSTADPHNATELTRTLLHRAHPQGLAGLIDHFHLLPDDAQTLVITRHALLDTPLREAATRRSPRVRENLVHIILNAAAPRLIYLVGEQLRQGPQPVHEPAANCLLHYAQRSTTRNDQTATTPPTPSPTPSRTLDARDTRYVLEAIDNASLSYAQHRQTAILQAICELTPRLVPAVMNRLKKAESLLLEDLRNLLESSRNPAVQRALLSLLAAPNLHHAVIAGLRHAAHANQLDAILPEAYLLEVPAIRRGLARIADPHAFLLPTVQLPNLTPQQSRGLVRWTAHLPLPPTQRAIQFAAMQRLPDTVARLCALRELIQAARQPQGQPINQAIARFCHDACLPIARIALRHLIHHNWHELPRLLMQLASSPHLSLRKLAADRLAPMGFERLWNSWPNLSYAQRLEAGRALLKIDAAFAHKLARRLLIRNADTRVRALAIIYTLNQGDLFTHALTTLCHERDERVAASAVRALGSSSHPDAAAALQQCLKHPNPRVRANAVESLEQLQATDHLHHLLDMTGDDAARPRANAIGALLHMRTGNAVSSLANMLADDRPNHRISALWLVENMSLIDVARQVAEMSLTDPDPAVRQRAEQSVNQLIHVLTGRPAPQTHAKSA